MVDARENLMLEFPADGDYIPAVRKFVAEATMVEGFTQKFAYRTEIIIDELCNNAVKYGPSSLDARVRIACEIFEDSVQLTVQDAGGVPDDIRTLQDAIASLESEPKRFLGRGLEIVKMLSSSMELARMDTGETVVRVVKRRSQNILDSLTD